MPSSPVFSKKNPPLDAICATDAQNKETYLVGGTDGTKYSNTLYRVRANKSMPDAIIPCMYFVRFVNLVNVSPPPRIRHAMTFYGSGILLCGGKSEHNHTLGDIWYYSIRLNRWERVG